MTTVEQLDMSNRDPNNINDHISVSFDEIIAEPDGVRSVDCVWQTSYKCFNIWNSICYKLATIMCGMCTACCWGCEFAMISFHHIWCVTPCLRVLDLNCGALKKCWGMCIKCCLDPICESCALFFGSFRK